LDNTGSAAVLKAIVRHPNGMGFKLNEYDKCMANKTIKGWLCTIIWNVYNLKISHLDKRF